MVQGKSVKKYLFILIILGLAMPLISLAGKMDLNGPIVPCGTKANPTPCTLCDIFVLVQRIIDYIIAVLVVFAPIFIVIGGIMILVSGAKPEQVSLGKRMITNAIIGVIISLLAWTLVNMVFNQLVSKDTEKFPWPWYEIKCEGGGITPGGDQKTICCADFEAGNYICTPNPFSTEKDCNDNCKDEWLGQMGLLRYCCLSAKGPCQAPSAKNRCNQRSAAGNCFNNNYYCLLGVKDQISNSAGELDGLLDCMAPKLPSGDARNISSITDNSGGRCFTGWDVQCSGSVDSCTGTCCAHIQNSLHYGGAGCRGTSYAVDFATESAYDYIHSAAKSCATELNLGTVDVIYEGNHVHVELDGVAEAMKCK